MSTSITEAFIRSYADDVKDEFQRRGSLLLNTVRRETGVVGQSHDFYRIGKGSASTKARHGVITPMNQQHTSVRCTLEDFYAGDYVDKLDENKISINERMALARGGAMALGRKIDEQITTALDSTTQTTVSWTVTSAAGVRNSMLKMLNALWSNDVPNDGMVYGVLTPTAWAMAQTVDEFSSADFVGPDGMPFREGAPVGRWRFWNGALWTMHTGLPGVGTATAKVFLYHQTAVGYAQGQDITADITWHGDRAAWFVNHFMSGGACLIEDNGVIEGNLDDTASLPTS